MKEERFQTSRWKFIPQSLGQKEQRDVQFCSVTRKQSPFAQRGKVKSDAGLARRRRSPEHWTRSRRGWAASSQAGNTSWWEDSSSPESPFVEAGM